MPIPSPKTDTPSRNLLVFVGFLLFVLGLISIVIDFVGVKLIFLVWLDLFGPVVAFAIKIVMTIAGITIAVAARTSEDNYDEFFDGKDSLKPH